MLKPHIVILGAGFGGTYVAKKLAKHVKAGKIAVTIINRTNYFLFTPLLHEVATGSLTPTSVAEPLREIFVGTGIHIAQGTVKSIDRDKKRVYLTEHHIDCSIAYDYLVIATGAETNYYGIPGAEKHSLPLKSLLDATRIRSRIIDVFEQAVLIQDPAERSRLLSFVVVGGGATGVETAAELSEFIQGLVKRYFSATKDCSDDDHRVCRAEEPSVSLIHTGAEVLPMFVPSLRAAAEKRLRQNGVRLHLNSTVDEVTTHGIKLGSGEEIPSATVIWSAGVRSIVPEFVGESITLAGGRMVVDEHFRLNKDPHVFALGDVAGYADQDALAHNPTKTALLPMLAQVATGQAAIVARNLVASIRNQPLSAFDYKSKGSMVSVGQWFAIGEIFSIHIAGRLTWWLWRMVYLFKFASWKKRLRIAFEWMFELVYPRDITKLT